MTPAGWMVMILSVGSVLTLVSYCLYRVLSLPPVEVEDHLKAHPDIDTGDTDSGDYTTIACRHCHKINERRAKYCSHCGKPIHSA